MKTQGKCHLQSNLRLIEAGREDWNRFSLKALRKNQPRQHVDFQPPELRQ